MLKITRYLIHLLILSCLFLIIRCDNPNDPPKTDEIWGGYRWIETYGGLAGVSLTPESEGYDIIIGLYDNNQYTYFKEDSTGDTSYTSTYRTVREPVWGTADTGNIIYIDSSFRAQYELKGDTLIFMETCIDCFNYKYIKLGQI